MAAPSGAGLRAGITPTLPSMRAPARWLSGEVVEVAVATGLGAEEVRVFDLIANLDYWSDDDTDRLIAWFTKTARLFFASGCNNAALIEALPGLRVVMASTLRSLIETEARYIKDAKEGTPPESDECIEESRYTLAAAEHLLQRLIGPR